MRRRTAAERHSLMQAVLAAYRHLERFRRAHEAGDDARADHELEHAVRCLEEAVREAAAARLRPAEQPDQPQGGLPPPLAPLSEREMQVLRLLASGLHNREIALVLSVAESTVNTHVDHIMDKLGIEDRVQAAVWAARQGLGSPEK